MNRISKLAKKSFKNYIKTATPLELIDLRERIKGAWLTDKDRAWLTKRLNRKAKAVGVEA